MFNKNKEEFQTFNSKKTAQGQGRNSKPKGDRKLKRGQGK